MRKYQPIWDRVKKDKKATLIAPASLHPRIIQAVRKEKSLDIPFRNLAKSQGLLLKLRSSSDENKGILTFTLDLVSGVLLKKL